MAILITKARTGEDGNVLVAVIGVMAVITALALGAFTLASDNMFSSNRERNSAQALHVAEAGMDAVMWKIRSVGASVPPVFVVETNQGRATVTAEPVGGFQWKMRSTGSTFENAAVTRTLTSKVFRVSLWNFVMGAGSLAAGGGGSLVGNTSVKGPFYIRGNLPLSGNAYVEGGPLFVRKGDIRLMGSARIGQPSSYIDVFVDGTHPVVGSNFYARVDVSVPDLQLPPLGANELNTGMATAKLESTDGYQGTSGQTVVPNTEALWGRVPSPGPPEKLAGFYKVIDDDGTVNGSAPDYHISADTTSFGISTDDFAWDKATRTLYVYGTVFVDGDISFDTDIIYDGNGTILANGNITVNGQLIPKDEFAANDALGLTTPFLLRCTVNSGNNPAPTYADADVCGAWYGGQEIRFDNNIVVRGSILASVLTFTGNNNHILTDARLPDFLPPSMPGGTGLMVFPTRWHEGNN